MTADRGALVRRGMHVLIAFAPLYYSLPDTLPMTGLRRWVLLIAFFAGVSIFEGVRLWKGFTFLGLRPHERHQIASFVWAAAGITATLWLFPQDIASGALIAMAIVDPIAGELRQAGFKDPVTAPLSLAAYFVLCLLGMSLLGDRQAAHCLLLSAVGGIVAVPSERFKMKYVDDDFVMLVLPALVMAGLAELI